MSLRQTILRSVILLVGLLAVTVNAQNATDENPYRIVAYYSSYNVYDMEYFVTDIQPDLLTHINYRPVTISVNGQCITTDEWADTGFPYPGDNSALRVKGNVRQLQLMRGEYPDLKILLTVGGWEFSENFSDVALTKESRARFARSCVAMMREYNFDGLDIDWRYPLIGGANPDSGRVDDKENYPLLLEAIRAELDDWAERDERPYLLTALTPATETLYEGIDFANAQMYLDWLNVAAYGYHGSWSEIASPHAPLLANTRDPRSDEIRETYNVDATVNFYLDAGIPADKIVLGVPFYAQTWSNVRSNDIFGMYESVSGIPSGTRSNGILYYRDLETLMNSTNYTKYFDEETKSAWMYNADRRIAVSYENTVSIQNKAAYVRRKGLGGMMIWELGNDDANDTLLNAVFNNLTPRE